MNPGGYSVSRFWCRHGAPYWDEAERRQGQVMMAALLWGFLGGVIAWFATNFVAQPLNTFFNARSGAARALARYGDLDRYDPEEEDPSSNVISDRRKVLADSGAELIAFAHSNQVLTKALQRARFFPQNAGDDLILLSDMKPHGARNDDVRQEIMQHLRVGRKFGRHDRI